MSSSYSWVEKTKHSEADNTDRCMAQGLPIIILGPLGTYLHLQALLSDQAHPAIDVVDCIGKLSAQN